MIQLRLKFAFIIIILQLLDLRLLEAKPKLKEIDDCDDLPCLNGGTCLKQPEHDESDSDEDEEEYRCVCRHNYTGINCETPVDTFLDTDCLNNGYKSKACEHEDHQHCICVNGFSGARCQIPPLLLDNNYRKSRFSGCLNNGYQPKDGLPCKCPDGFYGFMCEYMTDMTRHDLSACIKAPCRNGGVCSISPFGTYQCTCRNGFYGRNCENLLYRRTYGGFGSLLPFLLFFSLITMCVYCCCFKKNRNFTNNIINQRRFNDAMEASGRNPRYHVNTDSEAPNHMIYVQPNTATAEAPKNDTDLPPSYNEVVKKTDTTANNPA